MRLLIAGETDPPIPGNRGIERTLEHRDHQKGLRLDAATRALAPFGSLRARPFALPPSDVRLLRRGNRHGCTEEKTFEVPHPEAPLHLLQRAGAAPAYGVPQLRQSEGDAPRLQVLRPLPRSQGDGAGRRHDALTRHRAANATPPSRSRSTTAVLSQTNHCSTARSSRPAAARPGVRRTTRTQETSIGAGKKSPAEPSA